jgi:MFS transporter, DHA2 family, multidrug resistance protein
MMRIEASDRDMDGPLQPSEVVLDAASAGGPPKATRREWIGLGVIALPCLLYSMDLTVLNLAVPALSADLRPSGTELLWIIDIYGFLVAGSLITMGTLGDRIGRRRLLLIGAAAFGAGSIVAAFSTSALMLIASRALLGIAGATLAPSTLSLIRNMFHDPAQRTLAIGVWISSYSAGAAIGPLIGGVLLEHFWWGSVFLISVPVMLLLIVLGPVLLPEFKDPGAGRLDLTSAVLSLGSVLSVIYGLKQVAETTRLWPAILFVIVGVGTAVVFVRRQRALPYPLLDLELLRSRAFTAALITYTLATFVGFGVYVFIGQYLQLVVGLSPLRAGLWTAPFALAFIVGSLLTPPIVRRVSPRWVMIAGLSLASVGFGVVALVDSTSGLALLVTGLVTYSLGLAPVFTLSNDVVIGCAPPERAGAAAALSETGSELGGALGIALLGSLGMALYRHRMSDALHAGIPAHAVEAASDTLGAALAIGRNLSGDLGRELIARAQESFVASLRLTAVVAAAIVAGIALATVLFSPPETSSRPDAHP